MEALGAGAPLYVFWYSCIIYVPVARSIEPPPPFIEPSSYASASEDVTNVAADHRPSYGSDQGLLNATLAFHSEALEDWSLICCMHTCSWCVV